jgi:hypothetical protein
MPLINIRVPVSVIEGGPIEIIEVGQIRVSKTTRPASADRGLHPLRGTFALYKK